MGLTRSLTTAIVQVTVVLPRVQMEYCRVSLADCSAERPDSGTRRLVQSGADKVWLSLVLGGGAARVYAANALSTRLATLQAAE